MSKLVLFVAFLYLMHRISAATKEKPSMRRRDAWLAPKPFSLRSGVRH